MDKFHLDRGGRKSISKSTHPVTDALYYLKKEKLADNPERGTWQIGSPRSSPELETGENETDAPRTIGSGDSEVYVYYYPRYQEAAQLKGESTFECKIGKTDDDSIRRIHSQTGTGMPEEAQRGLVIKTDTPSEIERCIHGILKAVGRHKEDAPGTEWFNTNPDEVEGIFNSLMEFQSAMD